MVEIVRLDAAGLRQYISSEEFERAPVIAISKHRAFSQLNNPRARPEDILLLLARSDNRLVGYLGVLPDTICTSEGGRIRCGWMSCLWVDPGQRGKKIAQKLINECFEAWDNNILLTEFTAAAGSLYHKTGLFEPLTTLTGRRWYIRSDLKRILTPKKEVFRRLSGVLGMVDRTANLIIDIIRPLRPAKSSLSFRYVTHVPEEAMDMIRQSSAGKLFGRQSEELNWILSYPWVLTNQWLDQAASRYHFTSFEKKFECRAILASDKDKPLTFLMYTCRNGHLRIPYLYFTDEGQALLTIRQLISQVKANTLTVYNTDIIRLLIKNGLYYAPSREITRTYLISRHLHQKAGDVSVYSISDGDGDCAFT